MGASVEINNTCPKAFPSPKIVEVETTLQKSITQFRDIVKEFEELHIENENFRSLIESQKEKCEGQTCSSCEDLKKDIDNRKQILESIVSALIKLNETKDFNILDTIFNIIYKDANTLDVLTPPKDNSEEKGKLALVSPKKEIFGDANENESMCEIEGTPGKTSPIIMSKKKNTSRSLGLKDKKKNWPIPEAKNIKLSYPTTIKNKPRLRQSRIDLVKLKTSCVVDLTCSPEAHGERHNEDNMQNIKKEVIDNDDTILPSPTSGSVSFQPIHKSMTKDSINKFKQPFISRLDTGDKQNAENKFVFKNINIKAIEDSVLQECQNDFKSPKKQMKRNNETYRADESISLLQRALENKSKPANSPSKRLLVENVNIVNTQYSVSILQQDTKSSEMNEVCKRTKSELEETVQKKDGKQQLNGICDKCKPLCEVYQDEPDAISRIKSNCARLQHKVNLRPKTPEGFWNPRWDVPEDTEEFNRRNDAL